VVASSPCCPGLTRLLVVVLDLPRPGNAQFTRLPRGCAYQLLVGHVVECAGITRLAPVDDEAEYFGLCVGAFALLVAGLLTGRLNVPVLRTLLHDAIAITGALFFLLMAATTFTLVLRLLGTDRLVNNLVAGIPGSDHLAVVIVLGVIGLCAFVLDAFEIIFVIIPIIIPPLLIRVADARWVSVLVLLALQSSFLLPPFGYALMMVRGSARDPGPFRLFVRALMPFLMAQWLLLVVVLLVPGLVHVGDKVGDASRAPSKQLSNDEINKLLNDMLPIPPLRDAH
jgi:TRAP-type mannitol/chloroaromatic compound transport system permease large subunit